jgi:membrane fusion protein
VTAHAPLASETEKEDRKPRVRVKAGTFAVAEHPVRSHSNDAAVSNVDVATAAQDGTAAVAGGRNERRELTTSPCSAGDFSVSPNEIGHVTGPHSVATPYATPKAAPVPRSSADLFRPEAVEFQQHQRVWGDVALLQPLSTKLMTWFIAATVVTACVFLCLAQYARKETAEGYLTPAGGTSRIFVPHQGTIRAVYVTEGQGVEAGQPLLTIDTSQITTDGAEVNSTMLEALSAQKNLLNQQIAAQQQRTASETERLTSLIRGTEMELAQLQAQIELQKERIRLSEIAVQTGGELAGKGHMAEAELNRRRGAALDLKQTQSWLEQQAAARQNQLTETSYALQQLPTLMSEKIQAIRNELSAVDLKIAELNGRRAYVVRAPIAGRVSTLQATVGRSAEPRLLQMEIVPNDAVLQAELLVPTRAIGFVTAGQKIRIMYHAFPYQHFGTYLGRITKVSQTIVTGADAVGPVSPKEPAYRVTATLERPDIDAKGRKIPLQPDMLLRADIILETRPLIRWLLDPVLSIRM